MPGFELFGDAERKEVNDVLESGVLMRYGFDGARNGHWKAKELEQELQKNLGVKHAQLTSSGTTALNVALAVLGVGSGDEVIMPTFTFVASFESILAAGATPILVDIDDTLTLCPKAVEAAITNKTKVIMPVHMCGSMADLDALKAICDKHNLILLEDACQAIGGSYKGQKLGTIGDAGCFSFDYVKTITCGEGGAMVTNDSNLAINADHYTDHGHDHVGNDRDSAGFLSFFMPTKELTDKVVAAFKEHGVDAYWNYYENDWHYVRKWNHLKDQVSLFPLSNEIKTGMQDLNTANFAQSDDIISRNISCLIKLSWTDAEVQDRAAKMVAAIKSVL